MRVARLLGMSFAILRTTESVKEYLPVIPPPAAKSAFTQALGIGLSFALGERNPVKAVVEGLAAAGAASVLHDAQDAAKRFTDNQIAAVVQRVPQRANRRGGEPFVAGPLGAVQNG